MIEYSAIKARFAKERDRRLQARPAGQRQYETYFDQPLAIPGSIKDRTPVDETVDVVIIGGGFSGLMVAGLLSKTGIGQCRIIERGSDFGGTWFWNRYPGAACDSMAYDYLPMLDETGYMPQRHFAGCEEIHAYSRLIGDHFSLYEKAIFDTTVISTRWCESEAVWKIRTDRGDSLTARHVVLANGSMALPKRPMIEGIGAFEGKAFHTSQWDYAFTGPQLENLRSMRVGIIGTGASAIQIVPELAKAARELLVFQRTPSSVQSRENPPTDPEWAKNLPEDWQAQRRAEAIANPSTFVSVVYKTLAESGATRSASRLGAMSPHERAIEIEQASIDYMLLAHKRIEDAVTDHETAEALTPWYMFGCKRPCFNSDYLTSFNKPHVHLVDTKGLGIDRITAAGPVVGGVEYPVDLLVYATGYDVQRVSLFNAVTGRNGVRLDEKFESRMATCLGIHSVDFPNFFIMGGRQSSFQFNITEVLEPQAAYVANCIAEMLHSGMRTIEPTQDSEDRWVADIVKGFALAKDFQTNCTPGYYNNEGAPDPRKASYPGGLGAYLRELERFADQREKLFAITP